MGEAVVFEHIRSWQAAGLIDTVTAERLRTAEASEDDASVLGPRPIHPELRPAAAPAIRLPGVTGALSAVDVFVTLGIGLLLAAWYWELAARAPALGSGRPLWFAVGTAIPGAAAALAGLAVREAPARVARSSGVLLLVAGVHVGFVAYFMLDMVHPGGDVGVLALASLAWAAAAVAFRRVETGLPTTAGLLASIVIVGESTQEWLRFVLFGRADWTGETVGGLFVPGPAIPFLGAAWWIGIAVVLALVGEAEARGIGVSARSGAAAGRRAFVARLVAGLAAVLGVASALLATSWPTATLTSDRLDASVGDGALLVLAATLVGLSAAGRTSAWLYPAALSILIGLSDLNARSFAGGAGMPAALLLEGIVLIAVGAGTEALRRRLGTASPPALDAPAPAGRGT